MIATSARQSVLLGLIALLIVVLVVLSGGVGSVHFNPGKPLPRGQITRPPVVSATKPVAPSLTAGIVFRTIVLAILIIAGIIAVIGAIVSPEFRRFLLRQMVPVGIILVAIYLLSLLLPPIHLRTRSSPRPGHLTPPPAVTPSQPEHVTIPTATPSHWWTVLIALGGAMVVVGGGIAVWWWLKLRRERSIARESILKQLGEQADIAASRLRNGDDPRTVVLRCYQQMCDILNKYGHVSNPEYFTPREFARQLHARGMSTEYADRLTAIFEQVRYGHRYGPEFAHEAVTCLNAIKAAYAPGG